MATRSRTAAMREALASAAAAPSADALGRLAAEVEAVVHRPVGVQAEATPLVALAADEPRGPWLGYLFGAGGGGSARCRLALGWRPPAEAPALRETVAREFAGQLGDARVGALPEPAVVEGVVVWRRYQAARLPSGHDLANDLHAMVMLHDLLAEGWPGLAEGLP
jgi:hypothetical protein